jgi:hypothetical protein
MQRPVREVVIPAIKRGTVACKTGFPSDTEAATGLEDNSLKIEFQK